MNREQQNKPMNIKNYTSGISAELTISRIETRLAAAGATGIMKMYDPKGRVDALLFIIELGGKKWSIRVPANVQACFETMWKQHCLSHRAPRESTKGTIYDQAHRTAWKLVQDWVDVQISMIVMKQAEFIEVFMPYVWNGQETYYQSLKSSGFKALPEKAS